MKPIVLFAIVINLLMVLPRGADTAKILFLPLAYGSHLLNFEQIATALIARGHELHAYMNKDCISSRKAMDLGIKIHTYVNDKDGCLFKNKTIGDAFAKKMVTRTKTFAMFHAMNDYRRQIRHEVSSYFDNDVVIKGMGKVGFDLCVLDGAHFMNFAYVMPYLFKIPVVSLIPDTDPKIHGIPSLTSFKPHISSHFSDEMTFWERIQNTFITYIYSTITQYNIPGGHSEFVSNISKGNPVSTLVEMKRKTKLWLVKTDIAIDYPQVGMPHVIPIGGFNTRPAKPLPGSFQEIADAAKNGLIIVSFGTILTALPNHVTLTLFEAFKQLNQTIIWKFTDELYDVDVSNNIHLLKWIPQNDLLAHPNTKLFITHCGPNGQFEALYHAVPMIGLPVWLDQHYNSIRMAKRGLGIHLEFLDITPENLLKAVHEIFANDTYSRKMAKHSQMFKDRPMTPMETLVYWVEHVIKFGSDHLVSPAIEYPWYSFWCVDVAVFFVFIGITILSCIYMIHKCALTFICKPKKEKDKLN